MTKEYLRVVMGENIRNERTARKMSIDELAELIGLTSGFVGLIERGKRGATAYTIFMISKLFEISVDNLFVRISDKRNELPTDDTGSLKSKIAASLYGLSDRELDFIIDTIKRLKKMSRERFSGEGSNEENLNGKEDD